MSGPCDDIRVLDLSSGQVGGIATMVLADFGADVLKVEPPGGDLEQAQPAAPLWLRGKDRLMLDLTEPAGRARLYELARTADVLVSTEAPGSAAAPGTDYEALAAVNPRLIYCSITGWGPRGPLAAYPADEALIAAKSGRMAHMANIVRREGPAFTAVMVGSHAAAQSALAGILAALHVRERTGLGQLVETSLLQGMFPYDINGLVREQLTRAHPERFGDDLFSRLRSPDAMPTLGYQPIMGSDGRWLQLANLLEHLFQASLVALDLAEDVLANPRYAGAPTLPPEEAEEVRNMMLQRARERPADEWMQIFRDNGNVAADYVGTAQEALSQPDLVVNGEVVEHEHAALGTVRQIGVLADLAATPGRAGSAARAAGEGGEQTAARWLAEQPTPAAPEPTANGATPPSAATDASADAAPLAGIVVLEFATIIAAPLAAALLADLGARVIKIEPTRGGDPMRGMTGTGPLSYVGSSKTTAGKESICLDLKSEQGQAIVRDLVTRADIIIHNYRPGVPERLGIGYEQVRELNPRIVWVSASGYGYGGPSAHRPAAHPIPGALDGGALMQVGRGWPRASETLDDVREASRQFFRANESNPDPNTSMVIVSAAMLGLHARRRSGEGQPIYVSMLGANAYANADDFLAYGGKPERPQLDAELFGTGPLRRLYRAAPTPAAPTPAALTHGAADAPDGEASWVCLSLRSGGEWQRFCELTEQRALATDPRFATPTARAEHASELSTALAALFLTRPADEWERLLAPAGVGCVRADDYGSAGAFFLDSEQIQANGFDPVARHAVLGDYQRWGPMVTLDRSPGRYGAGTLAGEHADQLLAELGFAPDRIADLYATGVVWKETPIPVE